MGDDIPESKVDAVARAIDPASWAFAWRNDDPASEQARQQSVAAAAAALRAAAAWDATEEGRRHQAQADRDCLDYVRGLLSGGS